MSGIKSWFAPKPQQAPIIIPPAPPTPPPPMPDPGSLTALEDARNKRAQTAVGGRLGTDLAGAKSAGNFTKAVGDFTSTKLGG